jgi:hypothetical protein
LENVKERDRLKNLSIDDRVRKKKVNFTLEQAMKAHTWR